MDKTSFQPLTGEAFRPYGWLLGRHAPIGGDTEAFSSPEIDFWQEHVFDPGTGGETELLGVNYRNGTFKALRLEMHRLTQQAVIPLTGETLQIVANGRPDGTPDLDSLRVFRIPVGEGICMRAGCWHATRVESAEVHCLMITRRSTTVDLAAHLNSGLPLVESVIAQIDQVSWPPRGR